MEVVEVAVFNVAAFVDVAVDAVFGVVVVRPGSVVVAVAVVVAIAVTVVVIVAAVPGWSGAAV